MIRALIVDDEAPARARLRTLLAGQAIDVVGEAADGHEGMRQIAALAPDLVFLDIQMPGLSGLDVAARLGPRGPRVVFCTAFDRFAIAAFEHQAADYLLKPVSRQRLMRAVARVRDEVVERRRRAAEDDEAARTQSRLMPRGGGSLLDWAAVSVPAGRIGGDCYDVVPAGPGRVALAVADVSGKGPYAGLLVAALQARLQAVIDRGSDSASAVLGEVNRLTFGTFEEHRFATLFFGFYDGDRGVLRCSSAGHPPALLVNRSGGVTAVDAGGPALGWTPAAKFPERVMAMKAGDTLVVYSDGITDVRSPAGDEFGTDRLVNAIGRPGGASAARIVERVMDAMGRFSSDRPADDDRTLLVARVRG